MALPTSVEPCLKMFCLIGKAGATHATIFCCILNFGFDSCIKEIYTFIFTRINLFTQKKPLKNDICVVVKVPMRSHFFLQICTRRLEEYSNFVLLNFGQSTVIGCAPLFNERSDITNIQS